MQVLCQLKMFLLILGILSCISVLHSQETENIFNYQISKSISAEDYISWDGGDFPHPSEIVGLFQVDKSSIVWITLFGDVVFYNYDKEKIISTDKILHDNIITKAIYHKATNQLYFCEKGKILSTYSIKNYQINFDTILTDFSNQDTITINDFAINPSGNHISTFTNEAILFWQKKQASWMKTEFAINKEPFCITFINDQTLFLGSYDGYGQIFDLENQKLLKSKKIFSSEVFQCSISKDKEQFAVTNQKEVKIYGKKFGYPIKIKSNLDIIGDVQWYNKNQILLTGNGMGFEIWDISKNRRAKLIASENVPKPSKEKSNKKPDFPKRSSYLIHSNLDSILNLKRINSKVTAIDIKDNYISTAEDDFDLKVFEIEESEIALKSLMNCYESIGKWKNQIISDIQIKDSSSVYVGSRYFGGGFDLDKRKVHPFLMNSYWMSYSQIDFTSFKDVKIFKANSRFENRSIATIEFEPYIEAGKKLSKLNKKIRKKALALRAMTNPSGFKVSPDQKKLITFDATGHIELVNLKRYSVIFSEKVTTSPIISCYFICEKEFIAIDSSGYLFKYKLSKNEELILLEKNNLGIEAKKTSFNGKDLIAFYTNNRIDFYSLSKTKFIANFENEYKNFAIDLVEFLPNQEEYISVLNEKTSDNINVDTVLFNKEFSKNYSSEMVNHSMIFNNDLIVLGNTFGDLVFYKKR